MFCTEKTPKIIEYAPAFSLDDDIRENLCNDALKIANYVGYISAGTLEFLVDDDGSYYFIEMNPRIQVEHTVTEMITGIDIVQSQILIAQGYSLNSEEVNIKSQEDIQVKGYSIQCRITTEDPKIILCQIQVKYKFIELDLVMVLD